MEQIEHLDRERNADHITSNLVALILRRQRDFQREQQRKARERSRRHFQSQSQFQSQSFRNSNRRRNSNSINASDSALHSGSRWTEREIRRAVRYFYNGRSFRSIARRLERTEVAVLDKVNIIRRAFSEGFADGNPLNYRGSFISLCKMQKSREQRARQHAREL